MVRNLNQAPERIAIGSGRIVPVTITCLLIAAAKKFKAQ